MDAPVFETNGVAAIAILNNLSKEIRGGERYQPAIRKRQLQLIIRVRRHCFVVFGHPSSTEESDCLRNAVVRSRDADCFTYSR